jgi:hypothetical protein
MRPRHRSIIRALRDLLRLMLGGERAPARS